MMTTVTLSMRLAHSSCSPALHAELQTFMQRRWRSDDDSLSVGRTAQGVASVQEQRYDDAANYHELSVQANPTHSSFHFFSACAHALARKLPAARGMARQGLEMEPGFRLRFFYELLQSDIADRYAEGGRLLGLPD
jgi:hypothetical protein